MLNDSPQNGHSLAKVQSAVALLSLDPSSPETLDDVINLSCLVLVCKYLKTPLFPKKKFKKCEYFILDIGRKVTMVWYRR